MGRLRARAREKRRAPDAGASSPISMPRSFSAFVSVSGYWHLPEGAHAVSMCPSSGTQGQGEREGGGWSVSRQL